LYGYKTRSPILREESESTEPGPKRERKEELYNEELHNLYASPNISRIIKKEDEMSGACSTHGE
jgi:hypothetical protein